MTKIRPEFKDIVQESLTKLTVLKALFRICILKGAKESTIAISSSRHHAWKGGYFQEKIRSRMSKNIVQPKFTIPFVDNLTRKYGYWL